MKRNKITSSEFIDEIEFTSDLTKLPNDDQYLKYTAFSAITHKKSPNNSDRLILYALCLLLLSITMYFIIFDGFMWNNDYLTFFACSRCCNTLKIMLLSKFY